MSKQKQIQELAPLIYDKLCKIDGTYHNLTPDKMLASVEAYSVAEMITDLNYRKESEVAEEIIKMIEQSNIGTLNMGGDFIIIPENILGVIKEIYVARKERQSKEKHCDNCKNRKTKYCNKCIASYDPRSDSYSVPSHWEQGETPTIEREGV